MFFFALAIILLSLTYYLYSLKFQTDTITPPESGEEEINTTPASPVTDGREEPSPPVHKVQVEILNGCGINGVAKVFQSLLRENGIDVVNTENYVVDGKVYWNVDQTFIIDQIGVTEQAKSIARILQLPLSNIESRKNPTAIYDISVVIGKDYKNYINQ